MAGGCGRSWGWQKIWIFILLTSFQYVIAYYWSMICISITKYGIQYHKNNNRNYCHFFLWTLFCGHFLWTLLVNTFCGHFLGHFLGTLYEDTFVDTFLDTFSGHFLWTFLWTLFVDTYVEIFLWTLFFLHFC